MQCSVEGCKALYYCKGFCQKHYMQMRYRGKIMPRGVGEPNDYDICGDTTKISIFNNKGELVNYCLIDTEDIEKVKSFIWHFNSGYVSSKQAGRLHNLVMDNPQQRHILVDHINRDVWDNRKSNLRICNRSQNASNSRLYVRNNSGFKGVSWSSKNNMWYAQIQKDKVTYDLGYYPNKEEAALAYNKAAKVLHGEFAYQNKILKRRNHEIISM